MYSLSLTHMHVCMHTTHTLTYACTQTQTNVLLDNYYPNSNILYNNVIYLYLYFCLVKKHTINNG